MDRTKILQSIKLFLGISDNVQDELLGAIIDDSEQRIISKINQFASRNGTDSFKVVPKEFEYIHRDVSIKRFNKLNSEGTSADSEEGRSYTWESSYLEEYLDVLNEFTQPKFRAGKGIMRCI